MEQVIQKFTYYIAGTIKNDLSGISKHYKNQTLIFLSSLGTRTRAHCHKV